MSWFKKHLNWSTVMAPFASLAIMSLLILVSLGFNVYSDGRLPYTLWATAVIPVLAGTFVLGLTFLAWILAEKQRSQLVLLVFIPLVLPVWVLDLEFKRGSSGFEYVPPDEALAAMFLGPVILALVGWIWLVFLKNRSSSTAQRDTGLPRLIIALSLGVLVLTAAFSAYSGNRVTHSYETYRGHLVDNVGRHAGGDYAFEYPRSYYIPFLFDTVYGSEVSQADLVRNRFGWFTIKTSSIRVSVWQESFFESARNLSPIERNRAYMLEVLGGRFESNPEIKGFNVTPVSVDGIPADHITLTIPEYEYHFEDLPTLTLTGETIQAVSFESSGHIWIIIFSYPEGELSQSDAAFDHLIQTFKVLPNN